MVGGVRKTGRRCWTPAECGELRQMYDAGVPLYEASRRLGKPYHAVRQKASRMKLVGHVFTMRAADTEAAVMVRLPGRTVPAVAADLGLTRTGVLKAARRLIARGLLVKKGYRGPYAPTGAWKTRPGELP